MHGNTEGLLLRCSCCNFWDWLLNYRNEMGCFLQSGKVCSLGTGGLRGFIEKQETIADFATRASARQWPLSGRDFSKEDTCNFSPEAPGQRSEQIVAKIYFIFITSTGWPSSPGAPAQSRKESWNNQSCGEWWWWWLWMVIILMMMMMMMMMLMMVANECVLFCSRISYKLGHYLAMKITLKCPNLLEQAP